MKRNIILAIVGLAFLAGCDKPNSYEIPVQPKWQGLPYHLSFDTAATKPNPAGITIPGINYTANPAAVERRASLVVRFDTSGAKTDQQVMDQMIMAPVDISGAQGALPADYMDATNKGLSKLLAAYHMKGKIKVSVLLARSSINRQATDDEIGRERLSDWLPIQLDFKSGH